MPEFSETFFEFIFEWQLLIIDFCGISSEVDVPGVGSSYLNIIVLRAIIISIIIKIHYAKCYFLIPEKLILDFDISVFTT